MSYHEPLLNWKACQGWVWDYTDNKGGYMLCICQVQRVWKTCSVLTQKLLLAVCRQHRCTSGRFAGTARQRYRRRHASAAAIAAVHRAPAIHPALQDLRLALGAAAGPASPCCHPNTVVPLEDILSLHRFTVGSESAATQSDSGRGHSADDDKNLVRNCLYKQYH